MFRDELDRVVPKPTTHFVTYHHGQSAVGIICDSLSWLNWAKEHLLRPAKRSVHLGGGRVSLFWGGRGRGTEGRRQGMAEDLFLVDCWAPATSGLVRLVM